MAEVTLYRGDCLKLLARERFAGVDAVVTDPPYGVGFRGKRTKHTIKLTGGYSLSADGSEIIAETVIPAINECLQQFGRMAVFPGVRAMPRYPAFDDLGGVFFPNGSGRGRWGFQCFHPVLFYGKCPTSNRGQSPTCIRETQRGQTIEGHPCPKPLAWMLWLIKKATLPGETVLDPFMGSGTTGVACKMLGRNFIGIEIDPAYFKIAKKRIKAAQSAALYSELANA